MWTLCCGLLASVVLGVVLAACSRPTDSNEVFEGVEPDPIVLGMLEAAYPSYEVLGSDYSQTEGLNAFKGPSTSFVVYRWSFALHNPDLPGKPLVISYIRVDANQHPIEEWTCLDEFFAGEAPTDVQLSLLRSFEEDHRGESCLGAYEVESASDDERVFQVGYSREQAGGTTSGEYTYVLSSGTWSWAQESDLPDARWGTIRPSLDS
jgi:hypothetical protein